MMFKSVSKVSFTVLRLGVLRKYSGAQRSTEKELRFNESVNEVREENVELNEDLINHLERTSLVDFGSKEALSRLTEAIKFAEILQEVDTTGIEPMVSVLEHMDLPLREDKPKEMNKDKILSNASLIEEDFFVAPPGNIPMSPYENKTHD